MSDVVTALRGGHPHDCDFCRMPYNEKRRPIPEEGGLWACPECERKWKQTDRRYSVAERLFGDD